MNRNLNLVFALALLFAGVAGCNSASQPSTSDECAVPAVVARQGSDTAKVEQLESELRQDREVTAVMRSPLAALERGSRAVTPASVPQLPSAPASSLSTQPGPQTGQPTLPRPEQAAPPPPPAAATKGPVTVTITPEEPPVPTPPVRPASIAPETATVTPDTGIPGATAAGVSVPGLPGMTGRGIAAAPAAPATANVAAGRKLFNQAQQGYNNQNYWRQQALRQGYGARKFGPSGMPVNKEGEEIPWGQAIQQGLAWRTDSAINREHRQEQSSAQPARPPAGDKTEALSLDESRAAYHRQIKAYYDRQVLNAGIPTHWPKLTPQQQQAQDPNAWMNRMTPEARATYMYYSAMLDLERQKQASQQKITKLMAELAGIVQMKEGSEKAAAIKDWVNRVKEL
ncbi:MAG: hypothetical protein WCJ35_03315 [Planctomycetota bacterium]